MGDWEQNNLVNELTRAKEIARKLEIHLKNNASSSSWLEAFEFLVQRIVASHEKALSMLNSATSIHFQDQENSDGQQYPQDAFMKRKSSLPRWTQQVRVNPGMGLEVPLDYGFSWRKYAQNKDILGAKYPRGYYRCAHRNDQGCLATKQVLRLDKDPTIFKITYEGRHTCAQVSHNNNVGSLTSPADQRQEAQTANQQQQQQSPVHKLSNSSSGQTFSSIHLVSSDVTAEAHEFVTTNPLTPDTLGTNYFSVPEVEMGESGAVQQNLGSYESSEIAETITAATTSAMSSPIFAACDDFPSDSKILEISSKQTM